ncbi:MAG TPA: amino acid ABC transporter substrate-binding protein [Burkholderiales bacterium]|nr:amino acid ABC transporter substrate-binding protein [Burkholderiales bacterium]
MLIVRTNLRPLERAVGRASAFLFLFSLAHVGLCSEAPIRIGASVSVTGQFAELGQTQQRGQELCVRQVNARGGLLGRKVEIVTQDDRSQASDVVAIYEKLLGQDKVDLVFSPYSSPLTEAVANVTEKYRMPMIAAGAATTSIFKKGRKYIFMLLSPAEIYLEGLIDVAAKRGLKTIAILYEDTLFPKAIALGTVELAKKRGIKAVVLEAYPRQTTDFAPLLAKLKAANPDVVAAATYFNDAVAITRQMKAAGVNPKMHAVTVGGDVPKFYETLGRDAEFVYGASQWLPELVTLRAGGLIPIARQYPGAREFTEDYGKAFPGAGLSYHTAQGYAACQILLDAVKRAGSLDRDRIRNAILGFEGNTAYGAFKVDADGFQIAHKMVMFQWQDGKKVIVWPEELAADRPRFPTPPWTQRR